MAKKTKTTKPTAGTLNYRIPAIWNCWGYQGPRVRDGREILVHPARYAAECIQWIYTRSEQDSPDTQYAGSSLSRIRGVKKDRKNKVRDNKTTRRPGDWIRNQLMYGMMIRTSTAWDHDGDHKLNSRKFTEMGTFIKSTFLLPHLKRMGISVLYLLPVVKVSHLFRKGELGCPYSAKNFFELDPDQHDSILGPDKNDLEMEFSVFVECAHRLNMRVMIDVAPRTTARDADWILDHPDWYYWIDRRFERTYKAPKIPGVEYLNPIPGRLHEIFDEPEVRRHLAKFRFDPGTTHPEAWANFSKRVKKSPPANLLKEIAAHFGVVTPPGFSDVVNDEQPPWSDVTYLRLFMDHPTESARQLCNPKDQPPYVLFDTAKASLFQGRKPNKQLWNELADIIPFYQQFGIDGARVDMAHALPKPLEEMILANARKQDPDFCFLAEELGTGNHSKAYAGGYNIIIGPSWWMQPRGHEGRMHEMVEGLPPLKVPIMAAAETPDTPRAMVRHGGKKFTKQAVVVNCFLPNAVPMIHSGMEVFERQPINLGLDSTPSDRYALPKADPLSGKLGFFDRYALHWTNPGSERMIELIGKATTLRQQFTKPLTNKRAYFAPKLASNKKSILATGFSLGKNKGSLIMIANLDYKTKRRTSITNAPTSGNELQVLLELDSSTAPKKTRDGISITLSPGDVKVIRT